MMRILTARHLHQELAHAILTCDCCVRREIWHVLGGHDWIQGSVVHADPGWVARVAIVHSDRRVSVIVTPIYEGPILEELA